MRPILTSLLCLALNLLNPTRWHSCVSRTKTTLAMTENCHLPVDSGSCDNTADNKEETRYYYSSKNLKCSEFPYSGCKGNANNFKTMEDCEQKCGKPYAAPELVANILRAIPQLKCWYGNKTYEAGDSIPPAADDGPCSVTCRCHGPNVCRHEPPEILCPISPITECVNSEFGPKTKGCVHVWKDGACCPTEYCPPAVGQVETIHKCKYKGIEYVEGQAIQLPPTEDYSCLSCYCNKNFKGVLTTEGGVCREVNCEIQSRMQSQIIRQCIPNRYDADNQMVKYRARCCPFFTC